jgi:ferredoxin
MVTEEKETQIRVRAAREVCIGSGMCALTAPEVFDQDGEDGLVVVLRTRLPHTGPDTEAAREAAVLCPSGAISVRPTGTS